MSVGPVLIVSFDTDLTEFEARFYMTHTYKKIGLIKIPYLDVNELLCADLLMVRNY